MKLPSLNFYAATAAALLAAGLSVGSAQTTATTDPVGFMTVNITGGSGNAALSFKSLGLTQPVEYQGAAEVAAANSTTITDNDATSGYGITVSASTPYYVELADGPAAGTTYDVASISGATITLSQSLAATVTAPVSFKLRKHWTIAGVFGASNTFALQGGTATTADTISIYSGSGYTTYYYQTQGLGGTGWRRKGAPSDTTAGNDRIYPDDGLVITRASSTAIPVLITGAVKTGQSSFPIKTGLNIVSNPYAAAMTLASCGIYTGNAATGLAGGTSTTADTVLIWTGTGYDKYYYQTSGLGGTGWRKSGFPSDNTASTTQIPVGAAIVIQRTGGDFNWVIPQHPTTL